MSTLVKLTFSWLRALPLFLRIPLAQTFFVGIMLFLKKYRQETGINYQRLTGKKPTGFWVKNAAELGKNCALMLEIGKRADKKILDRVEIKGENILMQAYKQGRGVVVVSLHFGPWEFLPPFFARKGYSVAVAAQPQRDVWLDDQLQKIRSSQPVIVTNRVSEMKEALRNGSLLGFLIDNSSKTRRIAADWVLPDFKVLRTPFALAAAMHAPILPMVVYKHGLRPVVEIGEDLGLLKNALTRYPKEWVFFGKQ